MLAVARRTAPDLAWLHGDLARLDGLGLEPGFDLALAADWVEAGAAYVGGCCGTAPSDIAALAARLDGS